MKKTTFKCGREFILLNSVDENLQISINRYQLYTKCACCNAVITMEIDFKLEILISVGHYENTIESIVDYLESITYSDFENVHIMYNNFTVGNVLIF